VSGPDPAPREVALTSIRRPSDGAVLLGIGTDPARGRQFVRPVGGGIEPGETPEQAARREILEEVGYPLGEVRALGVVENRYTYRGRPGHEVAHLFEGRFSDPGLEERGEFPVAKKSLPRIARWFPVEHLGAGGVPLVPEGLRERLPGAHPGRPPLRVMAVDGSGTIAVAVEGRAVRCACETTHGALADFLLAEALRSPGLLVGLGSGFRKGVLLLGRLREGGFSGWPRERVRLPAVVAIDSAVSAPLMDACRGELLSLAPAAVGRAWTPWGPGSHPR